MAPDRETRKSARAIYQILSKRYPNVRCELDFSNPLELTIATVLSAQCTDKRVNQITPALFKKYKTAKDYANKKDFQKYNDGINGNNVNPHVPRQGIYLAVLFIKVLLKEYEGDLYKAAAAYNAGPGVVNKAVKSRGQNWKDSLVKETANYISDDNERSVPNLYKIYKQAPTSS